MKDDRYIDGSLDARHLRSSLARAAGFPAALYGDLCSVVLDDGQWRQMAWSGRHSLLALNHNSTGLPSTDHPAKPYGYSRSNGNPYSKIW